MDSKQESNMENVIRSSGKIIITFSCIDHFWHPLQNYAAAKWKSFVPKSGVITEKSNLPYACILIKLSLICSRPKKGPGKALIAPCEISRGVHTGGGGGGGTQHQGASLPDKCLRGCCFQNRWWYYILSGWRRRGSPVDASRRPGEVCWSLLGAARTHIQHTHRWSVRASSATTTAHARKHSWCLTSHEEAHLFYRRHTVIPLNVICEAEYSLQQLQMQNDIYFLKMAKHTAH